METDWKEFEELVARIEQALVPAGAVVKTNDWIRNNLTGRKRQVDASIRYNIGSVPVLITVECRKRKHKQDDTWIEQLVTKKQNLGAAKTIAVTSEDISDQAKINAHFYGIEIRKISNISPEDILDWLNIGEIRHIFHRPIITNAIVSLYSTEDNTQVSLHNDVIDALNQGILQAKVFNVSPSNENISVDKILDAAIEKGLAIFADLPFENSTVHRKAAVSFPPGTINILTNEGKRDVSQLVFEININTEVAVASLQNSGFSYSGAGLSTIRGIESHSELWGDSLTLSLMKQDNSDTIRFVIKKKKKDHSQTPKKTKGKKK